MWNDYNVWLKSLLDPETTIEVKRPGERGQFTAADPTMITGPWTLSNLWSRNGERFLIPWKYAQKSIGLISLYDKTGNELDRVQYYDHDQFPPKFNWSADGTKLLYSTDYSKIEYYDLNTRTSQIVLINSSFYEKGSRVTGVDKILSPTISPNNSMIATSLLWEGNYSTDSVHELLRTNIDRTAKDFKSVNPGDIKSNNILEVTRLHSLTGDNERFITWLSDNKRLLFLGPWESSSDQVVMPLKLVDLVNRSITEVGRFEGEKLKTPDTFSSMEYLSKPAVFQVSPDDQKVCIGSILHNNLTIFDLRRGDHFDIELPEGKRKDITSNMSVSWNNDGRELKVYHGNTQKIL